MKLNIKNSYISYKLTLISALISFLFVNFVGATSLCSIDSVFTEQNKSENSMQTQPDLVSIHKNVKKLFTNNKLPKDFDESSSALNASINAYSMLVNGRWLEALFYLFKAEENFAPGSIHILRDIMNNKYPQIPAEITQAIRDQFQIIKDAINKNQSLETSNKDPIDNLFKIYNQRFAMNEKNLAIGHYKESKIRLLWYNLSDLITIKNKYVPDISSPSLETQIPLLSLHEIEMSKKSN